jgi:hypothetical protein
MEWCLIKQGENFTFTGRQQKEKNRLTKTLKGKIVERQTKLETFRTSTRVK